MEQPSCPYLNAFLSLMPEGIGGEVILGSGALEMVIENDDSQITRKLLEHIKGEAKLFEFFKQKDKEFLRLIRK